MSTPYLADVLRDCQGKVPSDYPRLAVFTAAIRLGMLNDKHWRGKATRRIKTELIKQAQEISAA
jgi:hypothetical protein